MKFTLSVIILLFGFGTALASPIFDTINNWQVFLNDNMVFSDHESFNPDAATKEFSVDSAELANGNLLTQFIAGTVVMSGSIETGRRILFIDIEKNETVYSATRHDKMHSILVKGSNVANLGKGRYIIQYIIELDTIETRSGEIVGIQKDLAILEIK